MKVCPDLWKGRGGAWSFPGLGRSQGREGLGQILWEAVPALKAFCGGRG